jgi:hypothetical protein
MIVSSLHPPTPQVLQQRMSEGTGATEDSTGERNVDK